MKRVVVNYLSGERQEYRCVSTSWSAEANNLALQDVASDQPGGASFTLVIPLRNIQWFKEDDR